MQLTNKQARLAEIKDQVDAKSLPEVAGLEPSGKAGFVYRAVHEGEDPSLGLVAAKPLRNMTVGGHVRHGNTHKGSQFISTTMDLWFAIFFGNGERKICKIDLSLVLGDVLFLHTQEEALKLTGNQITARYASSAAEVLLNAYVPPAAIVAVYEPVIGCTARLARTAKFAEWKRKQLAEGATTENFVVRADIAAPRTEQPVQHKLSQLPQLPSPQPPSPQQPQPQAQPQPTAQSKPAKVPEPVRQRKSATVAVAFGDWKNMFKLLRTGQAEARAAVFTLLHGKYAGYNAKILHLNGNNVKVKVLSSPETVYWMNTKYEIALPALVYESACAAIAGLGASLA